jgi:hypothetical protein
MNINKAVTYSLLAHIRNSGTLIKGPIDVFVPLVKRTLSMLNRDGVTKGESIMEIKRKFDQIFFMDIPIPVLSIILKEIANDTNHNINNGFQLYADNAFLIKNYVFDQFEEQLQLSQNEAEKIQNLFVEFCKLSNYQVKDQTSVFDFIDKNKLAISKYLSNSTNKNHIDYTTEAKFIEYFKHFPSAYEFIKKIYLGSILSCFLEYKTENIRTDIELVLDTNFIVGLLDLNTPESTHTCNKLVEIGYKQGYKFTVLIDTIAETQYLLSQKAKYFNTVFLQSRINPEDIYNACVRRNFNSNDLERIADNLEKELNKKNIYVLPNTEKYKNIARFSDEYTILKEKRNSEMSALHDAIAIHYVREKRGDKKIADFEKVNCWFVNNSNSNYSDFKGKNINTNGGNQPETIKCDELLNVLWLSNPAITKNIEGEDIAEIGLSSLVAFSLNETLPKMNVIKELEDNIQKYAVQEISDKDIILVSTRIVNRQLNNIQELNNLANIDKKAFVDRLKHEADLQTIESNNNKENLTNFVSKLQEQLNTLKESENDLKNQKELNKEKVITIEENAKEKIKSVELELSKVKEDKNKLESRIKEEKRNQFVKKEVIKWRKRSFYPCVFLLIIISLCYLFAYVKNDFKQTETITYTKDNIIFYAGMPVLMLLLSIIGFGSLVITCINPSTIKAFKETVEFPDEFK